MPVIESKDLTVKINTQTVLKKLSFTVLNNEQWAIVGPSGMRKNNFIGNIKGQTFLYGRLICGR